MNFRGLLVILALGALSGPALADKRLIVESRHPTALENRRGREKVVEQLATDNFRPIPRIVGGRAAGKGEYPWMAGLLDAEKDNVFEAFFCGATLIHPYWVLTAGHCVLGQRAEDIDVLVGATDLDDTGSAQRLGVAEIIRSPDYNVFTMDADYALLRLEEPATGTVMPVIDDPSLVEPGVEATVTGWGDTSAGEGDYPNRLQEVELPIVDLALANATPAYDGTLTGNMLAAGLADGGKDSCQGDSGGPLLVPSPRAPGWVLGGVVSFGEGCAQPDAYGIYTKIGNFRDFITGHIRPNYAAWERANGRRGEHADPDGNGRENFQEWAAPDGVVTKELVGNYLHLRFLRPYDAPEANYILEQKSSGGQWHKMQAEFVGIGPLVNGIGLATYRFPSANDSGVFRLRAEFSNQLANDPRPLAMTGGATGSLAAGDTEILDSRYAKTYEMEIPEGSGPLAVSLRSEDFAASVTLEAYGDADSYDEVSYDGNQGGGILGTDETFEFTPQTGFSYRLRVTSTHPWQTGTYELNVWDPVALAALPILSTTPIKGSLSVADTPDPFFLPGSTFFKDDYRLNSPSFPEGGLVEILTKSKGSAAKGIDDFLALIDAESGRLVAGSDDFAGKANDAGLRFIPTPGKFYLLRTSSSVEEDIGLYTLTAATPVTSGKKAAISEIAPGASASGKLSAASELDEVYLTFKRDYLLTGATPGQKLFVTLSSTKFDAYLIVLDASDLSPVKEGDVGGPSGGRDNARLEFTPEANRRYLIRATTFDPKEKGPFTLVTGVAP